MELVRSLLNTLAANTEIANLYGNSTTHAHQVEVVAL